jgi:hypothetical protein
LDSFDNNRVLASFFLLKILSCKKPYISRFGIFQTFKKRNFDIIVQSDLHGSEVFDFITYLSLNIFTLLSDMDLKVSSYGLLNKNLVYFFSIKDISFLRFVETHSAFYK